MDTAGATNGAGRTRAALASHPRDGEPLHASRTSREAGAAISGGLGEGAAQDTPLVPPAVTSAEEAGEVKLTRASTRFEIRIQITDRAGQEIPANKGLLRQLDEATTLVAKVRNRVLRWLYMRDAQYLEEHPYSGKGICEWAPTPERERKKGAHKGEIAPAPLTSLAYELCRQSPELSRLDANILAAVTKDTVTKWCGTRFNVLVRQTEGPPFWKPHQPIAIPHAAVKLIPHEDGSATVSVRVLSAGIGAGRTITTRIVPRNAWQREELRALTSGEWRLGNLILSRHATKRGRWFLRMAYTRLVPRVQGNGVAVVRRGMRSFLLAAASSGALAGRFVSKSAEAREIYDGGDLVAFKKQMDARRRSIGRSTRAGALGKGASGHGTKRRVTALKHLSDCEVGFSKERCKRAAAALVKFAIAEQVSEVVLEDFAAPKQEGTYWLVARWPWYELNQACAHACEAAGLKVRILTKDERPKSRKECPACGHVHAEAPSGPVWECLNCGMRRTPDQVDVLAMLRAIGCTEGINRAEEQRKATLKLAASAKMLAKVLDPLAHPKSSKPKSNRKRPGSAPDGSPSGEE